MPESPEPPALLPPLQAALVKHLPMLVRSLVSGLFILLGVAGAQVLWPGTRMDRIEAEVRRLDESHVTRLVGLEARDARNAVYTEGLAKLACEQNWNRARLVLPCGRLLGNSLPDQPQRLP
jgi:hypothetical protein